MISAPEFYLILHGVSAWNDRTKALLPLLLIFYLISMHKQVIFLW